ncbi:type IV pilus biogenesis protein PilP [Burkholderia sp. Ac-20365]|uniref:type IV pilus biogenesis protein PilP n=1 Tax=Burkholderia sp. Ac-20365 TaxID=2703897 RepID=UPI00197BD711|nr:type IV pilus biogenesis protein PilP [Burkholderia sp. Ac-20365]MBN3761067.1 type IV pilus biogenesis protein PilP [Burkholderia sp. Ac-20365]
MRTKKIAFVIAVLATGLFGNAMAATVQQDKPEGAATPGAVSASPVDPVGKSQAQQAAELDAEAELLSRRLKVAELKRKLAEFGDAGTNSPTRVQNLTDRGPGRAEAARQLGLQLVPTDSGASITIDLISASEGHWQAWLTVNGRSGFPVSVGSTVAGGWTVRQITEDSVELEKGKRKWTLKGA